MWSSVASRLFTDAASWLRLTSHTPAAGFDRIDVCIRNPFGLALGGVDSASLSGVVPAGRRRCGTDLDGSRSPNACLTYPP